MIRIVGGDFRGRKLKTVPGCGTRPLLDRVREALFNVLQFEIAGAEVWDLFAGTGANGIEALSRGAARVVFVEKANLALRVLRDNLAQFPDDVRARTLVLRGDAWDPPAIPAHRALSPIAVEPLVEAPVEPSADPDAPPPAEASTAPAAPESVDPVPTPDGEIAPRLVFMDPPYPAVEEDPTRAVDRLASLFTRVAPRGVLAVHFPAGLLDEDDLAGMGDLDLREWGTSAVALIRRPG